MYLPVDVAVPLDPGVLEIGGEDDLRMIFDKLIDGFHDLRETLFAPLLKADQTIVEAGLDVGVYFFSQSTGAIEAAEEANFVLELISPYEITMPVAFDWEPLEDSRASDIDRSELTASAMVFCEMVKDAGYTPCVYLYRYIGYYEYDMD